MFQSPAAPSNPRCPFALYPRNPGAVRCGFLFQIVHLHYPVETEGLRVLRTLLPSDPNPYGSKLPTDWGLTAPRFAGQSFGSEVVVGLLNEKSTASAVLGFL